MTTILLTIGFLVLLAVAALTAAGETSIIAVSRLRIRRLAAGGSRTARIILKILEFPERFFGAILVANNMVGALIASIMTAVMITVIGDEQTGVIVATALATFLIIVSEVTAKTLAANHAEKLSFILARPIKILIIALAPIVRVFAVITNGLIKMIGGDTIKKAALITEEEIRALIKISEEEDLPRREKYAMLSKVFDFNETLVKSVMTPRKEVFAIDSAAHLDDILGKVLESGYSRIPVYAGSPDRIVGVVNMKDLLNLVVNRELILLQDIVYPVFSVPETKKVTELLKEFQKGHAHLAVVVDQKGALVGIVTIEDLLEEIVGEIKDEHDIRQPAAPKNGA